MKQRTIFQIRNENVNREMERADMAEESLDRLVESLALINVNLEGLRVSLLAVTETKADHEHRLRSIERWRYQLSPLVALITFILGAMCNAALARL